MHLVLFFILFFIILERLNKKENEPFDNLPSIIEKEKVVYKEKNVFIDSHTGKKLSHIEDAQYEEIKD